MEEKFVTTRRGTALGLETVDIVSMSLGAWIAQLFAWRYPHRVRSLVAWESPGVNPAPPAGIDGTALPERDELLKAGRTEEDVERILTLISRPGTLDNWSSVWSCVSDADQRDLWSMKTRLPEMQMPIQFGNVDTNPYIPLRYTWEMFNLAPNGRLEIASTGMEDLMASLLPAALRFLQLPGPITASK